MSYEIIVGNIRIEVIRKKIKNLHLYVQPPDGKVKITAPIRMKDEAIRNFAISKVSWIKKHQERFHGKEREPEKEYITGEAHYYQGKPYLLNVVHTNKKQRAEIGENNQIYLYVREGSSTEKREHIMMEWYRSELKKQIPDLIAKWENNMNVKVNSWGVKMMKTRWGTCNPKDKRIWINMELVKKDTRCLEYIVVHEMTHLLVRGHNKRFYAYMERFIPNWKDIKKELNG